MARLAKLIARRLFVGISARQIAKLYQLGVLKPRQVGVVGVLVIVSTILEATGLALILPILDYIENDGDIERLVASSEVWRRLNEAYGLLGWQVSLELLCMTAVVLVSFRQIMIFVRTVAVARWKEAAARDLSERCFRSVMSSKPHYVNGYGLGRFLELLLQQCQSTAALLRVYVAVFALFITFGAYTVLIVVAAPWASLLALGIVGGVVASLQHFVRRAAQYGDMGFERREQLSGFAAERYRGWMLVRLSDSLDRECTGFRHLAQAVYKVGVAIARNGAMVMLLVSPVMTALAMGCLYVAVVHLELSSAVITLFVLVLIRLVPVAQSFATQRQAVANYGAALERVSRALSESSVEEDVAGGGLAFSNVREEIRFEDVTFRYPGEGRVALRGVTCGIPAGKITALVGPSGAGKSTLVSFIPRLEDPQEGIVSVDKTPLSAFAVGQLRERIAYVAQTPFLFRASILDNLRYERPDAEFDTVVEACRLAHADEFVRALPDGYDTMLGEDGARLSGGERQRLVIARALLCDARIMILDEPSSALDHRSEGEIQAVLRGIVAARGLTMIIIAHRPATIRAADHVLVMEEGRVVVEGTPDVLRNEDNWFREMVEAVQI